MVEFSFSIYDKGVVRFGKPVVQFRIPVAEIVPLARAYKNLVFSHGKKKSLKTKNTSGLLNSHFNILMYHSLTYFNRPMSD